MVFDRPKRPGQKSATARPNQAVQRAQPGSSQKPKKVIPNPPGRSGSGSGGSGGSGGGASGAGVHPSPWLDHPAYAEKGQPLYDSTASFVEYLRWMRSPERDYKDPTKVKLLDLVETQADYRERLKQLNERTRLIAGDDNCFQIKSAWRIRVGGHRGPESILLPAFDALGMPYLPSSTLRGAARNQAIRQLMAKGLSWKIAEERIAPYFGGLKAEGGDRMGKVIFLDAYPYNDCKLSVDMANSIWKWQGDALEYTPNPNPFLSLQAPIFLVGLRRMPACDDETFRKIQQWLTAGLQSGIGSQVNSGYGELVRAGQSPLQKPFLKLEFTLQGQLIHGRQKFMQWRWNDRKDEWQMRGAPVAEVRPIAFKSMLRYWFRAFALGVLPPSEIQKWEGNLFGSIAPQKRGWVTVRVADGRVTQREPSKKGDRVGEQVGILQLSDSPALDKLQVDTVHRLFQALTWLMFHSGGLGQGARRPCYSRQSRQFAPWWRGSTLIAESGEAYWELPESVEAFQSLAQGRLRSFYDALAALSGRSLNPLQPLTVGPARPHQWTEAVDKNCRIVVCAGKEDFSKPYALSVLHSDEFKTKNRQGRSDYDPNLCGKVLGKATPSPIWIADLGDYQVVTVFGATQEPRSQFLSALKGALPIFPFTR